MGPEQTRPTVTAYFVVLKSGKRDEIAALLTDDCVWMPPVSAPLPTIHGGAEVAAELGGRLVRNMFDLSQPFALEVRRILADGDFAVVQQRLTATAKATGNAYDNQYCWIYTVRDGKIAVMEEYADTVVAARAMGWDLGS